MLLLFCSVWRLFRLIPLSHCAVHLFTLFLVWPIWHSVGKFATQHLMDLIYNKLKIFKNRAFMGGNVIWKLMKQICLVFSKNVLVIMMQNSDWAENIFAEFMYCGNSIIFRNFIVILFSCYYDSERSLWPKIVGNVFDNLGWR